MAMTIGTTSEDKVLTPPIKISVKKTPMPAASFAASNYAPSSAKPHTKRGKVKLNTKL